MGQYLAMGLTQEIRTSIEGLRRQKITNEELRQEIEQTLLFDLKLYDETETDGNLLFTLRNQMLETDLIPFLEKFYPMVYTEQNGRNDEPYQGLLEQLRTTPSAEWLELAHKKTYSPFRFDRYAEPRYIRFAKDFRPSVELKFNCVMLYFGYGKILTEGIDDLTDFFKYCIHETFKEYPIAKSMQVYITG